MNNAFIAGGMTGFVVAGIADMFLGVTNAGLGHILSIGVVVLGLMAQRLMR